jgi:hypothetical protein
MAACEVLRLFTGDYCIARKWDPPAAIMIPYDNWSARVCDRHQYLPPTVDSSCDSQRATTSAMAAFSATDAFKSFQV